MVTQRKKGLLMIILGTSLWGASGTAVQYLFQYKHLLPAWLLMVRMLISGTLFLAYAGSRGCQLKKVLHRPQELKKFIIYAIFGMFMSQFGYFQTINYSNAATATVLQYLMPVFILMYTLGSTKRLPDKTELTAVILAMAGTYLLVTKGHGEQLAISQQALFWGILSAVAAAVYTIYPRACLANYSSAEVMGWSMLFGGIGINVFLSPWPFRGIMDRGTIAGMSVLIVLGTLIAYYCYLESTRYIDFTEVGALASIEPLASVFLAVVLLHVQLTLPEYVGIALIISTVFILARRK